MGEKLGVSINFFRSQMNNFIFERGKLEFKYSTQADR